MSRRASHAPPVRHRVPVVWRVAIGVGIAGLLIVSLRPTIAAVVARANPELAHRLAPGDGRYLGSLAALRATSSGHGEAAGIRAQAQAALARDPTAVDAVVALAMLAEQRGASVEASKHFTNALRLSRREFRPLIWTIENSANLGDLDSVLTQYDRTLSVFASASDLLFPVLSDAVGKPLVRDRLVKLLLAQPVWAEKFLQYIADTGGSPAVTAQFQASATAAGLPVTEQQRTAVVNRLFQAGDTEQALNAHLRARPDYRRGRINQSSFESQPRSPSVFDWNVVPGDGISADIQPAPSGGAFNFAVSPGSGGLLLQKVLLLSSGRVRLTAIFSGLEQPPQTSLTFTLTCPSGDIQTVPVSGAGASRTVTGSFTIDPSCRNQILRLQSAASGATNPLQGQLRSVAVQPAGEG